MKKNKNGIWSKVTCGLGFIEVIGCMVVLVVGIPVVVFGGIIWGMVGYLCRIEGLGLLHGEG